MFDVPLFPGYRRRVRLLAADAYQFNAAALDAAAGTGEAAGGSAGIGVGGELRFFLSLCSSSYACLTSF